MLFTALISLSLLFSTFAEEPPCDRLRAKAEQIDQDYGELRRRFEAGRLGPRTYERRLNKLRRKERKIRRQARECPFEDKKAYNYWYRGRLKFPSLIQQELDRLAREKKDE